MKKGRLLKVEKMKISGLVKEQEADSNFEEEVTVHKTMDIISLILGPFADYLVEPIGRQFNYLLCYRSNIKNLENEVAKLRNIRQVVDQRVVVAQRDLQNIAQHIQDWLKEVDTIISELASILERKERVEVGCLYGCCPRVKSRYMLSRRAKKKTEEVVKLQNEAKDHVSFAIPVGPMGFESVVIEAMEEFESRKSVEKNVILALKAKNVNVIGLCGMGGVGKTLVAKKIGKMMKEENIFHDVVMAVVGQEPDFCKIQDEIAIELGLTLEKGSSRFRAGRLYTRLMDANKILIILDDVWRWLDLSELGIPSPDKHKGCKILLTSRLRNICIQMGARQIFTITVLPEAEAWSLFMQNVGNGIHDPDLLRIARNVALECKGLPIALVTVGRSVRNKSKHFWEDALVQLKRALPKNIPGVLDDVYRPLKLSYTSLESDEAKRLFLICCLFPEDAHIPIDILVKYGMGLHIFSSVENLKEARNRVHGLVETLRDNYLLVDNDDENYVQMHDVVRDVAIFISSTDKQMFLINHDIYSNKWPRVPSYESFNCISLISRAFDELPESLECPNLEMLLLECNFQPLKAHDNFFAGMRNLKVLEMQDFCIPSLPSSLQLCTSLRTLQLHCCEFVKEISDFEEDVSEEVLSMIAKLVNLEILSLSYSGIKALPYAIGNLRYLRLLDLTGCKLLNVIQPGIISRLVSLEEIYLKKSFANWGVKIEGKEGDNVSLAELESLQNLTSLEILIPETHLIPKHFQLSSKLKNYDLTIGLPSGVGKEIQNEIGQNYEKIVCLNLPLSHSFGGSLLYMLKNAEYLYSRGDGSNSVIEALAPEGFLNLKQLHLDACSLRHLANAKDMVPENSNIVFPLLEKIYLGGISCLEEICHGQLSAGSFAKLRHLDFKQLPMLIHIWKSPTHGVSLANLLFISLDECHRLQNLFSQSIAQSLLQLEHLKVNKCNKMEEIVSDEEAAAEIGSSSNQIKFPKLRYLGLEKLGNFIRFCKWIENVQFPLLCRLRLNNLPKLKNFFHKKDSIVSIARDKTDDVKSLFDEKESFLNLQMLELFELASVTNLWSRKLATGIFSAIEELKVVSCHGLKNLLSSSVAKGLVNLKELEVRDCSAMEVIIENDVEEDKEKEKSKLSLFPQLELLKLLTLEELETVFRLKHDLEIESLEDLEIKNCPKLSTFNAGSISTPNLKVMKVDDRELERNDLNSAIQQHFQAKHDEVHSKKNYFMLPANDLSITSGSDSRYWDWSMMKESSGEPFIVAELLKVLSLDVRGRIETADLSSGVTYEVAFVIMLRESTKGWEEPVNLRLVLPNGTIIDRTENLKPKPRKRWIELQLGDVEVSTEVTGDIEFALLQKNTYVVKRGLVIKGVIIRPKA